MIFKPRAAELDRHALTLVLAAMAHAAGGHEPRSITHAPDGVPPVNSSRP